MKEKVEFLTFSRKFKHFLILEYDIKQHFEEYLSTHEKSAKSYSYFIAYQTQVNSKWCHKDSFTEMYDIITRQKYNVSKFKIENSNGLLFEHLFILRA